MPLSKEAGVSQSSWRSDSTSANISERGWLEEKAVLQPEVKLFWVRHQESSIVVVNISKKLRQTQGDRRRDRFLSYQASPGSKESSPSPRFPNPKKQTNIRSSLLDHFKSIRREKFLVIHVQPLKAASDVEIKSLLRVPAL